MAKLLRCKCGATPRIVPISDDRDIEQIVAYSVWCCTCGCPMSTGPAETFNTKEILISEWNKKYRFEGEEQ